MTISTTSDKVSYAGNGVTTAFSFPYLFSANGDLAVLLVTDATGASVTQVLTTNYTVAGATNPAGGTVTMLVAPPTGTTLVIYRDTALTQETVLVNGDPLNVVTGITDPLDKLTMIAQRNRALFNDALRIPSGDTGFSATDMELPPAVERASKFLAFDSSGVPIVVAGSTSVGTPIAAYMTTLLDDPTAPAARATLGSGAAGDAVFTSATTADARNAMGAAAAADATLTGVPTAPTADPGTNTTQLATTAFVTAAGNLKADLADPALTGVPTAPTAAAGTNTTQIATTAFVQTAHGMQAFTTPGTYTNGFTAPATAVRLHICGGGGGGGGENAAGSSGGGGGPGAGLRDFLLMGLTIGATYDVVVGTGGAGGVSSTAGSGGASWVAIGGGGAHLVECSGGAGGASGDGSGLGGAVGTSSQAGVIGNAGENGSGSGADGGASVFGVGGAKTTGATGNAAVNYGAGGGGVYNASGTATGGAGKSGAVVFIW